MCNKLHNRLKINKFNSLYVDLNLTNFPLWRSVELSMFIFKSAIVSSYTCCCSIKMLLIDGDYHGNNERCNVLKCR